ncbi:MAG TPA: GNAT family N-acetyltransferase [Actinomycetota bacterium]
MRPPCCGSRRGDRGVLLAALPEPLSQPRPESWIPDLIVDPAVRRRGVGGALLQEAVRRSREAGCHELALESGAHRWGAHQFYRSAGMAEGLAFVLRL